MTLKQCTKCKQFKPVDSFHNQTKSKDGKKPSCIKCNKTKLAKLNLARYYLLKRISRDYQFEQPDMLFTQYVKQWRLKNENMQTV